MKLSYIDWERNGVFVIALTGRITLGEPTGLLRSLVHDALDLGKKAIVLNLREVVHIDSSGLGELVNAHGRVQKAGGRLKLANLSVRTEELLQITKLFTIFEVYPTEDDAVKSFEPAA